MSITYINSSYLTVTSGDATWTINYPTGTQAGDYLVLAMTYSDDASITSRDGFTQLEAVQIAGYSSKAVLMYHTADGVDTDADINLTITSNGVAVMLAFRNVEEYGDSSEDHSAIPGTTVSTTALTSIPTGSATAAFFINMDASSTCTHTTPSGYTEVQDRSSNASIDRSMSACYKLNASSSESPSSTSSNTQDAFVGFLISLLASSEEGMFLGFSF